MQDILDKTQVAKLFTLVEMGRDQTPEFPMPFDMAWVQENGPDYVTVPFFNYEVAEDTQALAQLQLAYKIEKAASELVLAVAQENGMQKFGDLVKGHSEYQLFHIDGYNVFLNPKSKHGKVDLQLRMVMPVRDPYEYRDKGKWHIKVELGMVIMGLDKTQLAVWER